MKKNIQIHKAIPNQGVLNYSHLLDAPAGKHGFVQTKHGHLFFEDGTRAKFLGFNVAARANTPTHETAEKLAERFASMGVNIIRLHAADAPITDEARSWSSCRVAPLLDYDRGNGRNFHPEGLDRFDYFIAKLKEKGIYLHIDLIVARDFTQEDGLNYPGNPGSCLKRYPMYDSRMIELQKEYAKQLLCHVNPYTGLALIDDPAVVTVQINNEESAIKGAQEADAREEMQPYREEVQRRFNDFLLMKYYTRERLKEAWTYEGKCALGEEEDPKQGTVRVIEGSFVQPANDPMGEWEDFSGPARYADFMEFGIWMNRNFYKMMKDYLHSLGVKVPIVTSNLLGGAADVYGHIDGDIMENNSYFNHPLLPIQNNTYLVPGPTEYVSVHPLTVQKGIGSMATTLLNMASLAIVEGKPFMLSEWNEYGEHPFHSTAFVHTIAYACLNDWDGLILYNHHTSENWDDQPSDEIWNVFDVYNDPAVICQWGFMASVFLKGLIGKAKHKVDIVYTQNDLQTLPNYHGMPSTFFPYIMEMRNVFLDGGEKYQGDADLAVNAGFLNGADLSEAKHGVYYAWSKYRDAMRKYYDGDRLEKRAVKGTETDPGVFVGEKELVFTEIEKIAGEGDYRQFAKYVDDAMKSWNILEQDAGYLEGKLVSDTKEIIFDPEKSKFQIKTPFCSYFSGKPDAEIEVSDKLKIHAQNERISISCLPMNTPCMDKAADFILTALGTTGMDQTIYKQGPVMMGIPFTECVFQGKLFAETLEGVILVKVKRARLRILDPIGNVLSEKTEESAENNVEFHLDGTAAGVQYQLTIEA